jgi:hypothetical protein
MIGQSNRKTTIIKTKRILVVATFVCALATSTAHAQTAPKMKMTTEIPPEITTPDSVGTLLGTLRFSNGRPDAATVKKVYDNLDFIRGVDVFLNTLSAVRLQSARKEIPWDQ